METSSHPSSKNVHSTVVAYEAQAAELADWAAGLPAADFARPSVLPEWDVRTLIGHLVGSKDGLASWLEADRAVVPALPLASYVRAFAAASPEIAQQSKEITGDQTPAELIAQLRAPVGAAAVSDSVVIAGPRGPITVADFARLRLLDLVVHCDDLNRSLPERGPMTLLRPGLATTTRMLAEILAAQAPGRSVEVRVPPFIAVQAVPGPRHTRGTPPNVVETDPLTWLRIATGRLPFSVGVATGAIRASGTRADLTEMLPLLS